MLLYQLVVLGILLLIARMAWCNHRDYRRPEAVELVDGSKFPLVSILVPARNEAANIEECLQGLLAQDYPNLEVIVLDDGSTDGTGRIVDTLAVDAPRLRRVIGSGLPPGWGGKTHACWQAAAHARGDWLLFLDADTRHQPQLVSSAMTAALDTDADLLSSFPRQLIGTLGEALTVPMMYWVFFTLLPIHKAQYGSRPEMIAACGQCYLVRRTAYSASGGHEAIAASLHDGLHLARLFKAQGYRVRLADLSSLVSCRMYRGWNECWNGFTRNSFQGFGSLPVAVLAMTLEAMLFLAPFLSLILAIAAAWPIWAWAVLGQTALLIGIQVSLRGRFRYPWTTVVLFPAAIAALIAIQVSSAYRTLLGHSVPWKGRATGGPPTAAKQAEA